MESKKNNSNKPRKVTSGPIRDKARTMSNMIDAVGRVLKREGYQGLTITNITKEAGVDRRLISFYFGDVDNLITTFLKQNDYWQNKGKQQIEALVEELPSMDTTAITSLLQGQFNTLNQQEILRKLIHWELGDDNPTLKKLAQSREELSVDILQKVEDRYANSNKDLRALLAIQIAGLYYLSLHASSNGSTFCGVDISTDQGKERINAAVESLVDLIFTP
ncbi:TetR/AcrR family transcriptional regulator [Myroides sp. LJL115]